jgi:hypothetical protein
MAETPYAETEVLLAVMSGDEDAALALLADMTARERRALQEYADEVSRLAWSWCAGCGNPIRRGDRELSRGPRGGPFTRYHQECAP